MRQASTRRSIATNSVTAAIAGSRARRLVWIIVLLAGSVLLTAAVGGYHRRPSASAHLTNPSIALPLGQSSGRERDQHSRLSFQSAADKLRRLLGQRFTKSGRERQTVVGALTLGVQQVPVRIVRTQNDDGEQVEIALGPGPASLIWSGADGAKSGARLANGIERQLIERLALDSPDQFVLAQLRSSYRTIATGVVPKGASVLEDYSGPAWDVVLVSEPDSSAGVKALSSSRLYYINTTTGLLDKVVSREEGQAVSAEFSGWVNQDGEKVPTRIVWRRNDQLVMELNLSGASHGPRQ